MANYNKSYNFEGGIQVDTDNFVVNAAGLVGIGTTIPTDYLDVNGTSTFGNDITVSGLVTSTNLYVSGITTAGIITGATYYGWSGAESPEGNRLFMWGSNTYGMLGQNDTTTRSSPTQVGSEYTWKALAQQHKHTAATKTDGTLWSWGQNQQGQMGKNNGTNARRSSPVQVPGTWVTTRLGAMSLSSIAMKV